MYADDVSTRTMKRRTLLLTAVIMSGLLLALAVALAVAVGSRSGVTAGGTATGAHDGEPATEEERAVAEYATAYPPSTRPPEWVQWGPHDLTGQTHFQGKGTVAIRVRFVRHVIGEPQSMCDEIFVFDRKDMASEKPLSHVSIADNPDGDNWLEKAKANKAAIEAKALKGP